MMIIKRLKDPKGKPACLGGRLTFNVPMKRHTTMHVGGRATALYQPESLEGLVEIVKFCKREKFSFLVIGNGSNIIVSDKGTDNLLIKLSSPFFTRVEVCEMKISCGGGVLLRELCSKAEAHSLGGAEFLIGIPGTVGGAIIQNAGAQGRSISDILYDVKVLDGYGRVKILNRDEIDFGYRRCGLTRFIIIGATFKLKKRDKKDIQDTISRYIETRLSTQDYSAPSAGSIFKNPEGSDLTAAELIDRCRLKGESYGGACVSRRHANFIINKKDATADDVLHLISLIRQRVKRRFGIELEEEVKVIT